MDQDYGMSAFFKSVDVAVIGRKTYDRMLEFAPQQASFPEWNYVFSTSAKEREGKVKVVSGDLEEWVEMIRGKKGKDIWLVGGVTWCGNFSRRE